MSEKRGEVIPFGKYRGQEVEQLLGDEEYTKWLLAQPWFKERYGNIYTVIINQFGQQPVETPAHNAMQVKFLKVEWRLRFFAAADPGALAAWADRAAIEGTIRETVISLVQGDSSWLSRDGYTPSERSYFTRKKLTEHFRRILPEKMPAGMIKISAPKFEDEGADVVFGVESNFLSFTSFIGSCVYRIELKPTMGDDFPEVLRQMKRNNANCLLVQQYGGEGATEEEVVQFFKHAKIRMLFESELHAVTLPDLNAAGMADVVNVARAFDPSIWTITDGVLVPKIVTEKE